MDMSVSLIADVDFLIQSFKRYPQTVHFFWMWSKVMLDRYTFKLRELTLGRRGIANEPDLKELT